MSKSKSPMEIVEEMAAADNNVAAIEAVVIGTVISDPMAIDDCRTLLRTDFSTPSHRTLWGEILALDEANNLSETTLIASLNSRDLMGNIVSTDGNFVGIQYIGWLVQQKVTSLGDFAPRVLAASARREVRAQVALMLVQLEDPTKNVYDIIDQAESTFQKARRDAQEGGSMIGELLSGFENNIHLWLSGNYRPAWEPKVIKDLRVTMQFLEPEDFVITAARPGRGKSSWLRAEFFETAKAGQPCAIFNLENGPLEYARYLISHDTGINSKRLRDPRLLSVDEINIVRRSIDRQKKLPLKIISLGSPSAMEVLRRSRALVGDGFKLIGADYLQLIKNGDTDEVRDLEVTATALRGFCMKYKVPIIAAAQLNRSSMQVASSQDTDIHHLRGSGALEQSATVVILIQDGWKDPTEAEINVFPENRDRQGVGPRVEPVYFNAKKVRNGETGRSGLVAWDKAINRFHPINQDGSTRAWLT